MPHYLIRVPTSSLPFFISDPSNPNPPPYSNLPTGSALTYYTQSGPIARDFASWDYTVTSHSSDSISISPFLYPGDLTTASHVPRHQREGLERPSLQDIWLREFISRMGPSTVEGMYAALGSTPGSPAGSVRRTANNSGDAGVTPVGCISGLIAMFGSLANGLDVLVNHVPRQRGLQREVQRQRQRQEQRRARMSQNEEAAVDISGGVPAAERASGSEMRHHEDRGVIRRARRAVSGVDNAAAERVQPQETRSITAIQSLAEVLEREEAKRRSAQVPNDGLK